MAGCGCAPGTSCSCDGSGKPPAEVRPRVLTVPLLRKETGLAFYLERYGPMTGLDYGGGVDLAVDGVGMRACPKAYQFRVEMSSKWTVTRNDSSLSRTSDRVSEDLGSSTGCLSMSLLVAQALTDAVQAIASDTSVMRLELNPKEGQIWEGGADVGIPRALYLLSLTSWSEGARESYVDQCQAIAASGEHPC